MRGKRGAMVPWETTIERRLTRMEIVVWLLFAVVLPQAPKAVGEVVAIIGL